MLNKNILNHNHNNFALDKQPPSLPKCPRCEGKTEVVRRNKKYVTAFCPIHGNFIKWGVSNDEN